MGNGRKTDFGRLWALRVVLGRARVAQKRARDGLRTPSWAVLAAKLAVLAAMLAVLDAKLAARDTPNGARSRLRALFERVRKLERRSYQFLVVFVTIVDSPNLNFRQPVQCFVHFARIEHRTRTGHQKSRKSTFFGLKIEPGTLEIELGRPLASKKSREDLRRTSEFLKVGPNEQVRARKERMLERK